MNIRLVISNYKNKDGKSKVLFDCSENTYRKKINTVVRIQKVEKIFLSSLFKKNKNFLGVNKFKLLANLTKKTVVILGGISNKNINKLKLFSYSDFAGITYFE